MEKWKLKEKQFVEELEKKQRQHDAAILAEVKQRKIEKQKILKEKEEQIAAAKELYPDAKKFSCCPQCLIYKAFPDQFHKNGLCTSCHEQRAEMWSEYRNSHKVVCACGLTYVKTSDAAKAKHESSDRHKKNMQTKLNLDGKKYTVKQLRQICVENKVLNASRMSQVEIVEALNKLPKIKIPEFKE
jgi:hypothetical protein